MTNASFSFDTLRYSKKLKAAGYTDAQAEAQAEALLELIEDKLATKQDLKDLEQRLIIKFGALSIVLTTIVIGAIKLIH